MPSLSLSADLCTVPSLCHSADLCCHVAAVHEADELLREGQGDKPEAHWGHSNNEPEAQYSTKEAQHHGTPIIHGGSGRGNRGQV